MKVDANVLIVAAGGRYWAQRPADSAALKLLDGQISDNRMLFEEVAPATPR